eukprot:RCo042070
MGSENSGLLTSKPSPLAGPTPEVARGSSCFGGKADSKGIFHWSKSSLPQPLKPSGLEALWGSPMALKESRPHTTNTEPLLGSVCSSFSVWRADANTSEFIRARKARTSLSSRALVKIRLAAKLWARNRRVRAITFASSLPCSWKTSNLEPTIRIGTPMIEIFLASRSGCSLPTLLSIRSNIFPGVLEFFCCIFTKQSATRFLTLFSQKTTESKTLCGSPRSATITTRTVWMFSGVTTMSTRELSCWPPPSSQMCATFTTLASSRRAWVYSSAAVGLGAPLVPSSLCRNRWISVVFPQPLLPSTKTLTSC